MRIAIELFNAHLDGHPLTREQSTILSDWIMDDPANARTIILLAQVHESLDSRMCLPRMLEDLTLIDDAELRDEISQSLEQLCQSIEESATIIPPEPKPPVFTPRLVGAGVLVLAATLLLAFFMRPDGGEHPLAQVPPHNGALVNPDAEENHDRVHRPAVLVATVEASLDAHWTRSSDQANGDAILQGETVSLEQGILLLETNVGHQVVLEGPVEAVFQSPQQLHIQRGKAVGRVGIHGGSLEFSTPTASVRDLGTEFGVDVEESLVTSVDVLEGSVEVVANWEAHTPIEVRAGYGVSVSDDGIFLESPQRLPHDRRFVRTDEVSLRMAGNEGDQNATALATYYALVRSNKLLAYQGFHAPSLARERTISFDAPIVAMTDPVTMGSDLLPESRLASGGLHVGKEATYFLPIDVSPESAFADAGLVNEQGVIGQAGKEVWIAWREQAVRDPGEKAGFAGLSLSIDQSSDQYDTFLGRVHDQRTLGVQFNDDPRRDKYPLDIEPQLDGVQTLHADGEVHHWIARVVFGQGGDTLQVWLDVPANEVSNRKPNFEHTGETIRFDRLRLGASYEAVPWVFDEIMMAASLNDLADALDVVAGE